MRTLRSLRPGCADAPWTSSALDVDAAVVARDAVLALVALLLALLPLAACGRPAAGAEAPALTLPTGALEEPVRAAATPVSPEMSAVVAAIARGEDAAELLGRHHARRADRAAIAGYVLRDPEIIDVARDGAAVCYALRCHAGLTTRSFRICWEGKRVVSVRDAGVSVDAQPPAIAGLPAPPKPLR